MGKTSKHLSVKKVSKYILTMYEIKIKRLLKVENLQWISSIKIHCYSKLCKISYLFTRLLLNQ